jgi:hypothetical protein
MHDWVLLSVLFEWEAGRLTISFDRYEGKETLVANSVVELQVPQLNEWGPSICVNRVNGPIVIDKGLHSLEIEMQSGDVVRIVAQSFQMPAARPPPAG